MTVMAGEFLSNIERRRERARAQLPRRAGAAPSPWGARRSRNWSDRADFQGGIWISRTQPGILPVVGVSRDSPRKPRFTRCWRRLFHQRAGDGPVSARLGRESVLGPRRLLRRKRFSRRLAPERACRVRGASAAMGGV